MRYPYNPATGQVITLDDLAAFVAEMVGYRQLPGSTPVRAHGLIEFDMQSGPRLRQVTADADQLAPGG
jgi:hypothetical protein